MTGFGCCCALHHSEPCCLRRLFCSKCHRVKLLIAGKERQVALDKFYEEWKDDSLVILKWLGLQTGSNVNGNLQNVQQLLKHPAVNITNPNTCYSVFLGFARSPVNFHAQDGSGYKFMADSTLEVRAVTQLAPSVQAC